jgi:Zn-dependent protease with chaperone function
MLPAKKIDTDALREAGEARLLRRTLVVVALVYLTCIGLTLSFFLFWIAVAVLTVRTLRTRYLAETIEVGEGQLPRVARLVADCAARLEVPAPRLFVAHEPGSWPVFTVPLPDPAIVISASWLKMLTDDELSFFIYHELAHGRLGHRRYLNPVNVMENVGAISWLLTTPLEIMRYLLRPWLRLADFSADRVALMCLDGRLEVAASALVKVTAGDELCTDVDARAYVAQARRLKDSWLLALHEVCTGRLGSARRLARLSEFCETALYRRAIGLEEEAPKIGFIRWVTGFGTSPSAEPEYPMVEGSR